MKLSVVFRGKKKEKEKRKKIKKKKEKNKIIYWVSVFGHLSFCRVRRKNNFYMQNNLKAIQFILLLFLYFYCIPFIP